MKPDETPALGGVAESLLEAFTAMSSDLDLNSVLARLVEAAAQMTAAKYAALGVIGPDGLLVEFVTTGVSDQQRALIGALPAGKGVLGVLINEPEPIRMAKISAHPASVGLPPHHPQVETFLGVPVRVRGTVFGNLYLCEKHDGRLFSEQDERLVVALARAAGFVIENARAYGLSELRRRWLEASTELTATLQPPIDLEQARGVITGLARSASSARATALLGRGVLASDVPVLWTSCDAHDEELIRVALESILDRHDPLSLEPAEFLVEGLVVLVIPLRAHLAQAGALVALFDPLIVTPQAEVRELLVSFADQAGLALDRTQAVVDRQQLAVISDRERIARDLHDVVIQRLFATGLKLQGMAALALDPTVEARIERAVDDLDLTIKAIRGTIFELELPANATSLRAEIRGLVREYVPVMGFSPSVTTSGPVDTAVSAQVREQLMPVLREAVSNVARHAVADRAQVEVHVSDRELRLSVTDDGIGLDEFRAESGLRNVRRRAADLGGSVEVARNANRGTTLVWRVPLSAPGSD